MKERIRLEQPDFTGSWKDLEQFLILAASPIRSDKREQALLDWEFGELELETPRDRQATFEPKIVGKRQTRWTGFEDKIISMYARGMTTREIQGHLEEIYSIEVSPALISNVTEAVLEEVKLWQSRPLDELYPIVYLDALMVKVRDEGHIQNKAIYVVLVCPSGSCHKLAPWAVVVRCA